MQTPRTFRDKKAFQYNWYMRILSANATSPIIILRHDEFSAQRLIKLRRDILHASNNVQPSLTSPTPAAAPAINAAQPLLTVIRTSIFGAALRDLPGINTADVEQMLEGTSGSFAILSLPTLNPPQLNAIIRAMDRGIPPRPKKTEEEIAKELADKNADPVTPGRRMKRVRRVLHPELRVVGALVEGNVLLPENVRNVSKLPTLETLRAQIVGLLSAPAAQLTGVLSQAGGGSLARTLEGLKKGLEEAEVGGSAEPPVP